MAAVETGEVVKATALAITSPADDMKSDGTQELQSSPANLSLEDDEDDEEEVLIRSLEYDLSMRLIVAHQIQTLKLDMKMEIDIYRSLLRDHDGECDRLAARRTSSDDVKEEEDEDDGFADAKEEEDDEDLGLADAKEEEEEEEETTALRQFGDMYAKAIDVDRRLEEFDEIVRVHYDPDLDNEARRATVARLWRRLEKELDDRAETVVSGAFKYTFAPLEPRLGSSTCA
ncbi:hypothetical protein CFC21_074549 [Triticum aestivum]|uniref:Uncharacterized protein n=2 Tax=Triticum aestivum TaxID=4565 RepID=A0A9R1HNQ9_WHEAT|nr:hypothetical protein CFC21_074547 [Triticum aestivum]KAF7068827.1 hypothetical protein CFC21_074548 [Triticum aestivum]KAF7068828.1 hypothetical protein CFC21_074549 [Triticum aestivum]